MSKESIAPPELTSGGVAERSHGGVGEISGLPKNEKEAKDWREDTVWPSVRKGCPERAEPPLPHSDHGLRAWD